jgi:hypothetical protein
MQYSFRVWVSYKGASRAAALRTRAHRRGSRGERRSVYMPGGDEDYVDVRITRITCTWTLATTPGL